MSRTSLTGLVVLLSLTALSCQRQRVVQSSDGKVEVTLPDGWVKATLPNTTAKLQAMSPGKSAYVVVVSESKSDFRHTALAQYAQTILRIEQAKSQLQDRSMTDLAPVQINGKNALRCELTGTKNNLNLVFYKTFIETDNRWNQVMCWTTPSHFDDARPDFDAICQSLREVH